MEKTIAKILLSLAAAMCTATAGAQEYRSDSLDFEFAVRQVEESYAGYTDKTAGAAREEYEALKERLREEIRRDGRRGYEAAGELFGWFGDFHLRAGTYTSPYLRPRPDYSAMDYAPWQVARRIDQATYLIRIPSFEFYEERAAWVAGAAADFEASGCDYLVVDIRGNEGGRDQTYRPLLALLYDRPGRTENVEIRVSADNELFLRAAIDGAGGGLDWLLPVADAMGSGDAAFVPFPGEDKRIEFERIAPRPLRAAILIDGNVASSGEQFLLDALACSDRVTIYGRDRTLGCLDFSNLRRVDLPESGITCWVPTTRSCRVAAGRGIDRDGIAPQVRIPLPLPDTLTTNVDEWVRWVAEELKTVN